jgi:hypothetical protein
MRDVVHPLAFELACRRATPPYLSSPACGAIAALAAWGILSWLPYFTRLEAFLLALVAYWLVQSAVSIFEDKFWAIYKPEFDKIHFGSRSRRAHRESFA